MQVIHVQAEPRRVWIFSTDSSASVKLDSVELYVNEVRSSVYVTLTCDVILTTWFCVECSALDITFLLDATGSVDFDYDVTQEVARTIVEGLSFSAGERTRVSVVTFQVDATVEFQLDSYTTKVPIT